MSRWPWWLPRAAVRLVETPSLEGCDCCGGSVTTLGITLQVEWLGLQAGVHLSTVYLELVAD